jgi:hypothetical protein
VKPKPQAKPAQMIFPAGLVDEFHDRPFGFTGGESTPIPAPRPAPAPRPFVIEPWPEEERRAQEVEARSEPAPPSVTAVEAMMNQARELGEIDEHEFGLPVPPQPPPPRFEPPPVDWEQEERQRLEQERLERERVRRERSDEVLRELLAEDSETYPRGKS